MSGRKIKDGQFITIMGWMRNMEAIQTNTELNAYALIYGFSQTEGQYLTCRQSYIAEWLKISRPKCSELLKRMESKGLIKKVLVRQQGSVKQYKYCCVIPNTTCSEREHDEFPNVTRASSQTLHATSSQTEHINNNIYNNILYISPQGQKKNQFCDFSQRQAYDFEQLERELLKGNQLTGDEE